MSKIHSPLSSYQQALQYLCQFTDYERMEKVHYTQSTYNLERMKRLLSSLGNPQERLRCIHIAGTKGKGSTALMIAHILTSKGYKVGLYTSPHLIDLRERIQVYPEPISKKDFTALTNIIIKKMRDERGQMKDSTFFELMTALGFLYFVRKDVDFAVIEVGLGGRLDATNLIKPLVSVITRIDFDHMDKLGDTLKEIATEKAGIIKEDIPVITFRQNTVADRVIKKQAGIKNAPLYLAKILRHKLPILGNHQSENWSLVLKTVEILCKQIKQIQPCLPAGRQIKRIYKSVKATLKRLKLPARLELISRNPEIIIDSAHNPVSLKATAETISPTRPCLPDRQASGRHLTSRISHPLPPDGHRGGRVIVIFALSRDKDVEKSLRTILPIADIVVFTRTKHPRLMEPREFLKYLPLTPTLSPWGIGEGERVILLMPDYRCAFKTARSLAGKEDIILVTGSFYLAGEIKKLTIKGRKNI